MRYLFYFFLLSLIACNQDEKESKGLLYSLEIEPLSKASGNSLRGISVIDSSTAWISGAKSSVTKISNGGTKLLYSRPPDQDELDYRDIHAFSKKEIVIASAGFPCRIYKSSNSGMEWKMVYEHLDSSAFLNSIHFKDSINGLVLGDQMDGYHFLLMTNDAGNSWTRVDSLALPAPLESEHGFAASGSCITVNGMGKYVIGLGGEKSRVLLERTDSSWEAIETLFADTASSSGIYSIASSDDLIMAVGGDYTKADVGFAAIASSNDGRDWESKGSLSGYRSVIDHSSVFDLWLAGGTNGIDISWDDGVSWHKISDLSINTLQFDDQTGTAYAANSEGQLYKLKIHPEE